MRFVLINLLFSRNPIAFFVSRDRDSLHQPLAVAAPTLPPTPPSHLAPAPRRCCPMASGDPPSVDQATAEERKRQNDARAARQAERDAALAHALVAEEEAAAASNERATVAARARDALACAALECKAVAASVAVEDDVISSPPTVMPTIVCPVPCSSRRLLPSSICTLRLSLCRAFAASSPSSSTSTPTTTPAAVNSFFSHPGKYSLQAHVLNNTTSTSPDWLRMVCTVRSWLYGSLSNNIIKIVMSKTSKAVSSHAT